MDDNGTSQNIWVIGKDKANIRTKKLQPQLLWGIGGFAD